MINSVFFIDKHCKTKSNGCRGCPLLLQDENLFVYCVDDFMEDNKGYEEAEYVDEKAKLISDQLDKIGKAFGIEPEKIEEVKVETEDGEVKA